MLVGTPEAVQAALFVFVFPLTFASSAFVPVDTMPSWLQGFAENQPLSVIIDMLRNIFTGQPWHSDAIWSHRLVVAPAGDLLPHRHQPLQEAHDRVGEDATFTKRVDGVSCRHRLFLLVRQPPATS